MDIPHFIYASVDGHLGFFFYFLAVMCNTAMNISLCGHIFFRLGSVLRTAVS